jgi:DNA-binding NarL/FixJ family response regulator
MARVWGRGWAEAVEGSLEKGDQGVERTPEKGDPAVERTPEKGDPAVERTPEKGDQRESRALGVVVGSDDPFTRQAFRSGSSGRGIQVLAEGTVTAVAEHLAAECKPDIVLLDVQIAAAQALRAIQHIRASLPNTRILACSAPAGTEFGLLCLRAGAWGYVSKEVDLAVLPSMLRALGHGEAVIPGALAAELVKRFAKPIPPDGPKGGELTTPECRLLEVLRTGRTLPDAAAELGVTLATARRHLGSARRKLAVAPPPPARGAPPPPDQVAPPSSAREAAWSRARNRPREGEP